MDFLKIGDGFPQNRWRISQNRWRISQKSVTDFPKIGGWFPESPASLAGTPTPKALKNTKRIFKYVHTCSKHKNNEGFPARNHSWSLQENANEGEPVDFLRQHVEMYLQTWHASMRVWVWCSVSSFRLSVCRWIPGQQPLPCSSALEGSIQNASNKQCWVARTKNYSKKVDRAGVETQFWLLDCDPFFSAMASKRSASASCLRLAAISCFLVGAFQNLTLSIPKQIEESAQNKGISPAQYLKDVSNRAELYRKSDAVAGREEFVKTLNEAVRLSYPLFLMKLF